MRALRIGLGGGRHLPTIGACSGGGRLLTRFTARGPRAEGHLALGNLSSLGQARRKLKNFPTKTMTSQRNKRQLRVINPCQDPEPRGQAGGPQGDQVPAPRVRNARGRPLAIGCRASPQTLRGLESAKRRLYPQVGAWGSCYPPGSRVLEKWSAWSPLHCHPVFCRVAFSWNLTRQVHRREANRQGRRCQQLAA